MKIGKRTKVEFLKDSKLGDVFRFKLFNLPNQKLFKLKFRNKKEDTGVCSFHMTKKTAKELINFLQDSLKET